MLHCLQLLILACVVHLSSCQAPNELASQVEPKLVCYYTNWAKDRPDPWAYVSTKHTNLSQITSPAQVN